MHLRELVCRIGMTLGQAIIAGPAPPSPVQTQVHAPDGQPVTLDVYPAVGLVRGAAILSHGFTRSRRTMAGHAQALADAGVLALRRICPAPSTSTATPGLSPRWWDFTFGDSILSPDQQQLLIGFHSPLRDGRALIARIENLQAVFLSVEASRIAPAQTELDLNGCPCRERCDVARASFGCP